MKNPFLYVDLNNALSQVAKITHDTSIDRGFDFDGDGEQAALFHAEVSEFLEAVRRPKLLKDAKCKDHLNRDIELADVVLRILGYCHARKINLADAIIAKLHYNKTRPRKHGGKKF